MSLHSVNLVRGERVSPRVDRLLGQPKSAGQVNRPRPKKCDSFQLRHVGEYDTSYLQRSRTLHRVCDGDDVETYADRIKHAMELANKRQIDLARGIGVEKATINSLLKSRSGMLNALNSVRAAVFLGVDHHWLATGEGEPRPLLMMERLALSAKAIYIGGLLDDLPTHEQREKAYALIVQMLEFGAADQR